MPNPYDLRNARLQDFSKPPYAQGPPPPTPARGTQFQNPLSDPGAITLPPLPAKPAMPFMPVPAQTPVPEMIDIPEPSGPMFPSGFDASKHIPGSMTSSQPAMNPAEAVSALKGMDYPELARIRNAHNITQQGLSGGFNGGAGDINIGGAIERDVMGSPMMAGQRAQVSQAQAALAAQHPAIAGLAERSALQKAYPQQAEAYGKIKSADITGEADVQKQMLASQASNLTSLRQAQPSTIQALSELMKLMAIEDLTPEQRAQQEQLRQLYLGILQRPFNRGGL